MSLLRATFLIAGALSVLAAGCQEYTPETTTDSGRQAEVQLSTAGGAAVADLPQPAEFTVTSASKPANGSDVSDVAASFTSGGKTTRFGIRIRLPKKLSDSPVGFADGELYRISGSDPAPFKAALATAVEARHRGAVTKKLDRLPVSFAILGERQSRGTGRDAGFSSNPPGDWLTTKMFLDDGQAEVYLNINLKAGQAEFAEKDPDYGDDVVREISKIL